VADDAPGFVWRLQTEDGDATAIRAFDDDMLLVNMSVWESVDALTDFVYRSDHRRVMIRRREWFERMEDSYMVLVGGGRSPAQHGRGQATSRHPSPRRSDSGRVHLPLALSASRRQW